MIEFVIPLALIGLLALVVSVARSADDPWDEGTEPPYRDWQWPPRPIETTRDELHAFYPALAFIRETHRREVRARDDRRP